MTCATSSVTVPLLNNIDAADLDDEPNLIIPQKFVRSHEEKLPERVLLKTPVGAAWAVDVESKKGEVSFQNGWPQFATFCSLSFGYLVVFHYMGHCNFLVRVYDTSAAEINYPNLDDGKSVLQITKIPTVIDDSSSCELIMPRKKTRASSASQEAFHDGPKLKQEKAIREGVSASDEEKDRALASANAFRSNKPFFIVAMKPTDVFGRSMVKYTYSCTYLDTWTFKILKWKNRNQLILRIAERSWVVDFEGESM
ncbi:hypothetical protein POM88_039427 [Heracleum sosnowskyi]|uniref:TF-B3 domain-containing protein n=1 Tax=Heracleum sosnowskyi TaxID=360622 RepID=A0AAD8HC80_9APIA|nr:hypothetical protein POM88_039427 [Heracleum sosnowskyi]